MIDVGALELHHPDGQVFTFEPGSLALAFAVTGPGTYDGPLALFQTLRRPSDLERWAADVAGAAGLRATDNDLELAVRLQAAIWSVADALIDRRPVPEGDRAVLNELAAQPCLVPRLLPGPTRTWLAVQGVRKSHVVCRAGRHRRPRRAACCTTQAVRGIAVLAAVRRHVAVRTPALVLHGALRQSRKGGGPPPPQEGE